jgi:aspartate aminotransferase-like enzyme
MSQIYPQVDPTGLLEYSVVYTDRALNHMSQAFQTVMRDIDAILKRAYSAEATVVVPGSGTFGMEAVARQFATGQKCLVLRNGLFSYRWTQILDMGRIAAETSVLKARPVATGSKAAFAPAALDGVVAAIRTGRPAVVFAPHVETASGMILPDEYLHAVGNAVREIGGLFVLDCIASGAVWVDMRAVNADVVLSAPQKSWSGPPCAGLVMLGERARERIEATTSSSFACDLRKWLSIMEAYLKGGHAYHATMPTDALASVRDMMLETERDGFETTRGQQLDLGRRARALLESRGFQSVAAAGFQAPGVIVSYTDQTEIQSGHNFLKHGLQIAAGVPLQCDEPADFRSFRLGLFGLDKLRHVERTLQSLEKALNALG